MASMWQKTMFYLGLVDDDPSEPEAEGSAVATAPPQVSSVDAAAAASPTASAAPESSGARPGTAVAGRRVEPPSRQRRRISSNPDHAEAGVLVTEGVSSSGPVPMYEGGGETEIIVARTFSDAQILADHIRAQQPVVLDLRNAETAMVRRLVDFASGLTYGLEGKMVKIGQGVILVMPVNVTIGMEERARLAELGLYSAPLND